MVTRRPLVVPERDTDKGIFKTIIRKISQKLKPEYVTEFIEQGDDKPFKHGYTTSIDQDKSDFKTRIIARVDGKLFRKAGTSVEDFCNLLDKLMVLEPAERLTATQALKDPFFQSLREDIETVQSDYPPQPLKDPPLHIIDCMERRWAVNIAFRIFNKRDDVEWYNHSILFHSLRLFDEYLYRNYHKNKKRESSTTTMGKLHTKVEVHLYFFTCIYMSYKYFTTLYKVHSWKEIFPGSVVSNKSNLDKIVKFENYMLKFVCKHIFFRPTLLEYLDRDLFEGGENSTVHSKDEPLSEDNKDLDVKIYLYEYGNIGMDYEGTTQDLYNQIKKCRGDRE